SFKNGNCNNIVSPVSPKRISSNVIPATSASISANIFSASKSACDVILIVELLIISSSCDTPPKELGSLNYADNSILDYVVFSTDISAHSSSIAKCSSTSSDNTS